jgi:hypothetical protein
MTLHDTIVLIAVLVNLIALGGFARWIVGWIRSLKGAVDAQEKIIAAQKEFIQGLQIIVSAADIPQMQQRYEAYKKTVDLEKEAAIRHLEIKLSDQMSRSAALFVESLIGIIAKLMPYAPHEATGVCRLWRT